MKRNVEIGSKKIRKRKNASALNIKSEYVHHDFNQVFELKMRHYCLHQITSEKYSNNLSTN